MDMIIEIQATKFLTLNFPRSVTGFRRMWPIWIISVFWRDNRWICRGKSKKNFVFEVI